MKKVTSSLTMIAIVITVALSPVQAEILMGWWTDLSNSNSWAGYKENGVNFLHLNGASAWFTPTQVTAKLDIAHSLGLKVSLSMTKEQWCPYPQTKAQIVNWVNGVKGHPAIYGYYIADEPNYATNPDIIYGWLRKQLWNGDTPGYYRIIKDIDSERIVWFGWSGNIYGTGWPDSTDQAAVWDYYTGSSNEFGTTYIRQSIDTIRNGLNWTAVNGKSPFIWVMQAFGTNFDKYLHDPTLAEIKYNFFTGVAAGVTRFLWWADTYAHNNVMENVGVAQRLLRDIKSQMEIGQTNSPSIEVNQSLVSQDKLIFRYGVSGNTGVILAVNIGGRASMDGQPLSNVKFTLPDGIRPLEVEVLNENRTLPIADGVFIDNFKRFEVHAYRFVIGENIQLSPPEKLRIIS